MNKVPLATKGRILKRNRPNWFIEVIDDHDQSGGYLILYVKFLNGPNGLDEGYDDWVESYDKVIQYFKDDKEVQWDIDWEVS